MIKCWYFLVNKLIFGLWMWIISSIVFLCLVTLWNTFVLAIIVTVNSCPSPWTFSCIVGFAMRWTDKILFDKELRTMVCFVELVYLDAVMLAGMLRTTVTKWTKSWLKCTYVFRCWYVCSINWAVLYKITCVSSLNLILIVLIYEW